MYLNTIKSSIEIVNVLTYLLLFATMNLLCLPYSTVLFTNSSVIISLISFNNKCVMQAFSHVDIPKYQNI